MEEAALEPGSGAPDKRLAWALSRDSWQASEADEAPPAPQDCSELAGRLGLSAETGHIPNEKIATWLKDCRTPLGASLDEQSNQKGILLKNGGSFEDDLSLGAEANHLNQNNKQMELTCHGLLAKDRRLQYHQKGRSMNSTGSGKSSATVSSVSELLDLYEEDPEDILYNLGFGRDEPDIASKIPSRFFNACSYARGIDIKVFLSAQMQRLEVENPNFALTSRFRQIEVLTTVANAFSCLYSQVSGTPLQKIGSTSFSANTETAGPAPLTRTPTANRLLKTISKLNLLGGPQGGESSTTVTSPSVAKTEPMNDEGNDDQVKTDPKIQKPLKKKDSPSLATVTEEAGHTTVMDALNVGHLSQEASATVSQLDTDVHEHPTEPASAQNGTCEEYSIVDTSVHDESIKESLEKKPENDAELKNLQISTSGKEPCTTIPNPSIAHLMLQPRQDSYELEEIQSTEGESTNVQTFCQTYRLSKDYFLRTASQHSDSSGFAEDASADYPSANPLQVHEPIRDMGSSADSCDSENTVTSEDLKTPREKDQPDFKEFDEDEFLTPFEMAGRKTVFFPGPIAEGSNECETKVATSEDPESLNACEIIDSENKDQSLEDISDLQQESTDESDVEKVIDSEVASYATHHITESADCFSDYMGDAGPAESSPLERVTVALQRAQLKVSSLSEVHGSRIGRSTITAKDLLKRRTLFAESGFPLRRTQSLPSALLSPVRVVSSVSVRLSSGKATLCSPPSFTYKYTQEEEEKEEEEEEEEEGKPNVGMIKENQSTFKSTHFVNPSVSKNNLSGAGLNTFVEDHYTNRPQTCPLHVQSNRSHSSCSLHSIHSDWQDRPLCEHGRAWSTQSVPSISGASCGALSSPFSCHYSQRLGGYPRPCSAHVSVNPPSAIEMQLRRVLHDIRNSLQNLNQYPVARGNELANASFSTQRPSILPLYENTFQELQVMRRSLNLFRTQMMDLELNMLRQQTMVYHQLTDEERYEADQLQGLRNNVRMELQELELQLEERLLSLEEQLRALHLSSPYRPQPLMGMYGSRSTDNLSYTSPLNVREPVTELIREQSYLKSELGFGDMCLETGGDATESVSSHVASDTSSVCSSLSQRSRRTRLSSSDQMGKAKAHSSQNKPLYRASVALTPTPPMRVGTVHQPQGAECVEVMERSNSKAEKLDHTPFCPADDDNLRTVPENDELQQVIREIKESIVGDIRREIVSGLLAAISSPRKSPDEKHDGKF